MNLQIKKASKKESKLRLSLIGVSGGGKTYTSLAIGSNLGDKILVVDTEHGSASKYADIFDFDVIELDEFTPENFIQAIKAAEQHQYDVIILDSLSHAWIGKGGILEQHGNAEARTKNSFTAWKDVTPRHNNLIEAIVQAKLHVIATMRAKTEHALKQENGKTKVERLGLAAVQRDGMEYEFDVVAEINIDNDFVIQKSRCPQLSGRVFNKAGKEVALILTEWLKGDETEPSSQKEITAQNSQPLKVVDSIPNTNQEVNVPDRLIKKIRSVLTELNKDESAFNTWLQKEYDSTMHWSQMSEPVLRELETKVTNWLNSQKSQKRGLKEHLMGRDELTVKIEELLKKMGKKESDFLDWMRGYFTMESITDWRKTSTTVKKESIRVLEEFIANKQQKRAA